jgi:putative ABC transport system permease protein
MKLILHNFLFLLKRFRTSSVLNIVGLSIAYAVFFVIVVQTYYDFSFDRNFDKADNVYMYSALTNTQIPGEHAKKSPEIKHFCVTKAYGKQIFEVGESKDNLHEYYEDVTRVTEGFVDIFIHDKIIQGDPRQIFADGNKVMLTESISKKFFGKENPLGQALIYHYEGDYIPVTVAAICKDFPDNCSFGNGIYLNQPQRYAGENGYISYLEIVPGTKDKLLERINKKEDDTEQSFGLTALLDAYLKFPIKGQGKLSATLSLLAIGIWLMIIAYINFINFSISMAPVRLKGLNIRRIFGESTLALKFSVAMESVLLSFVAFLISLVIVNYSIVAVKDFLQVDLSLSNNINPLLLTAGASLLMGFLAGIYPAFYTTSFKPAIALSGSFATSFGSKAMKNTLIVIQFTTALCLIIVASFIKIQHDNLQNKSWGINTENVIYLTIAKMSPRDARKVFEADLRSNPNIIDCVLSTCIPGGVSGLGATNFENTDVGYNAWVVSHNILRLFGIKIVEGRDFTEEDNWGNGKVIFNRAFVKEYGFKDIVGKEIKGMFGSNNEIIGITDDFNFKSLYESVQPISFWVGQEYAGVSNYMLIKINGQNRQKTIDYINTTWKKFSNENPDIHFLNETINQLYTQENNLAKLISMSGLITIIVAVMGVYGLILFNAKSKRKTIAIHKVNGATKREVILMLNRGFLVQFAIAYLIAVPLAYMVVGRWLENFAYKTPIHWWVFVAGGLLVFLIVVATVSGQSYKAASANPVDALKG